jgi:hypothetical protein
MAERAGDKDAKKGKNIHVKNIGMFILRSAGPASCVKKNID